MNLATGLRPPPGLSFISAQAPRFSSHSPAVSFHLPSPLTGYTDLGSLGFLLHCVHITNNTSATASLPHEGRSTSLQNKRITLTFCKYTPAVIFMALVFLTGRGYYIPVSFLSLNVCTCTLAHAPGNKTEQKKKQQQQTQPPANVQSSQMTGTSGRQKPLSLREAASDLALVLWTS